MLHAAAMLIGLTVVWFLHTQLWSGYESLLIGAGAALICVLVAARFFGVGGAFTHALGFAGLASARAPAVLRGAIVTLRAAIAADVTLKPALVRVRAKPSSDDARAALADAISALPGGVVVLADQDGLLVHVIDEDAVDAAELGRLETRLVAALDGKGPA